MMDLHLVSYYQPDFKRNAVRHLTSVEIATVNSVQVLNKTKTISAESAIIWDK